MVEQLRTTFSIGQQAVGYVVIGHKAFANLSFALVNAQLADKLPQTKLLKKRMRLRHTLDAMLHQFACCIINMAVTFVRTVSNEFLLAFERTLIEQDVAHNKIG